MFGFFKKKKRLVGTQVVEDFSVSPIPFRTGYGGCRPVDYRQTAKMRELETELYKKIDEVISCGLIDEYTNPQVFDTIITAYCKQMENEIERQYISFSDVIQSIKNVAQEELHRGKREEEILNETIADTGKKGKDFKKGEDLYVEIEK